jgi:high-affinity iron transporter
VEALTQPAGSGWEAFWQSFLIILREGFEAILVVGAVVAFLIKTGHRERLRNIWLGVAYALLASAATAVVLKTVLAAMPASREIIEGLTLLVAVGVLFSVSYWLISKVEAAKWQAFIRDKVNNALQHGGGRALVFVAFLAVYREGAETALFYQALFNEGPNVAFPLSMGIVAGFAAFVFMGKGIRELQEGNAIPLTAIPGFPHSELLGLYPSWQGVLAQLALLLLFAFAVLKTFWPKRSVTLPTVMPATPAPTPDAIAAIRAENEDLRRRLVALEESVNRDAAREVGDASSVVSSD